MLIEDEELIKLLLLNGFEKIGESHFYFIKTKKSVLFSDVINAITLEIDENNYYATCNFIPYCENENTPDSPMLIFKVYANAFKEHINVFLKIIGD